MTRLRPTRELVPGFAMGGAAIGFVLAVTTFLLTSGGLGTGEFTDPFEAAGRALVDASTWTAVLIGAVVGAVVGLVLGLSRNRKG
ncbi:hypothetical protein [Myceligenerans indicum]|uniref:Uncharacterized protein n=1 Tax=Myceligenerans indicum TaxID=2593663 RepID=A0ABS1LH21_9MICO|nr:hypothetical protein [Myceligenerans indicum]MBL0885443.1 hypothetical protein [Myceligenerans indicum]